MADDWTTVVPGPGRVRDVAMELLALAERPEDVMSQRGGSEFRIPSYLAERYLAPAKPPAPRRRTSKDGEK